MWFEEGLCFFVQLKERESNESATVCHRSNMLLLLLVPSRECYDSAADTNALYERLHDHSKIIHFP